MFFQLSLWSDWVTLKGIPPGDVVSFPASDEPDAKWFIGVVVADDDLDSNGPTHQPGHVRVQLMGTSYGWLSLRFDTRVKMLSNAGHQALRRALDIPA